MAKSESKRKPRSVIPPHYLPPERFAVVQIPRAVWSAAYWDLDWDHLVALAQLGQNGLSVTTRSNTAPRAPLGVAWIRQGDGGVAVLYHQNW